MARHICDVKMSACGALKRRWALQDHKLATPLKGTVLTGYNEDLICLICFVFLNFVIII